MQGITLKLGNVEDIKRQFEIFLKELQDKSNVNPILINFDELTKRLADVENRVKHSMDNVSKLSKKAINNALTGDNYKEFQLKIDEVINGLKKSGNQVSDVFTTIDAKTKAINGATVKYTDSLGKTITEVYKLKTAWKNIKDDEGNFVLDKNGNKTKQLYMELKPTTVSYDNNIAKQQEENYKKLNSLLAERYSNIKKLRQLDDNAKNGEYATNLRNDNAKLLKDYNDILDSSIKISETEKTTAINRKQSLDLADKEVKLKREVANISLKQNDPTLRKTSTTTSGQRNLGDIVDIGKSINFSASKNELNEYARAVAGAGAEWTKLTPKIDSANNKMKEVHVRTKEGSDKWHNYSMILDETTGKLYKVDRGLSDVSNRQLGFIESTKIAITRIAEWGISTVAIYGSLQKLREGLQFINDLNKSQTNIKMITDMDDKTIKSFTQDISLMADELYTTTDALSSASEEYLRAGHNISEVKNLLKSTQIASAISGQDAKTVSEQLIAITNGFQISTENGKELMKVIDAISALDNSSATSFKELATAMQYTSASAKNVGLDVTSLANYIATVSSITRRSAETIGQSFKTIFARFEDIKQGKKFDADNESLSNVEKSLNKIGIALRKDKDTFRDFNDVLMDLSKVWNSGKLSDVAKADITKSLAGTRQRETLLVLLDNMKEVDRLNGAIAQSSGSAERKFEDAYGKSTEAKIQKLKNQTQKLYMSMFNSDAINFAIGGMTSFVNGLNTLVNSSTSAKVALAGLTIAVIALSIAIKKVGVDSVNSAIIGVIPNLIKLITSGELLTKVITGLGSAFKILLSPVGLIGIAIGVATFAITKHIQEQKKLKDQINANTETYKNLTAAIKENNVEQLKNSTDNLKNQQKELQDLLEKRKQLSQKREGLDFEADKSAYRSVSSELSKVDDKIKMLETSLKDAGIAFNETTGNIDALDLAESRLATNNLKESIEKERDATINQKQETINLIQEYQTLEATESRNATQKERMSQIANQLNSDIQGLTLTRDVEGNVIIQNSNLLGKNIGMLNAEIDTTKTGANVKLQTAKNNTQAQIGETRITYEQIIKRIALYQAEMKAKQAALGELDKMQKGTLSEAQVYQQYQLYRQLENMQVDYSALNKAKSEIDAIFGGGGSSGANFGSGGNVGSGSGYIPSGGGSDSKKSAEDAQREIEKQQDEANSRLKQLRDDLSQAIRKKNEEDKENALKNLKEEEQARVNYYQGRIKQLQDEIDALQDTKEDNEKKLTQLKKELADWSRDETYEGNEHRENLQKQIDDLTKTIKIRDLEDKKKELETQQKAEEDSYKEREDSINKHYEELLQDKNIYAESDRLITSNAQQQILDLMMTYAPKYSETGSLLGKSMADAMLEEIRAGIDGRNMLLNAGYNSTTKSASGGSSGGSSWDGKYYKVGSQGDTVRRIQQALGVAVDGIFGNQTKNALIKFQNSHGLSADGIVGQNTWKVLGLRTGGYTGENEGIAMLHKKELVLNQVDTANILKAIELNRDLYKNFVPKFDIPKAPNIQRPQIIIPEGMIQQDIDITNNTPFDVDNNMNNLNSMFKNTAQIMGYKMGLIT